MEANKERKVYQSCHHHGNDPHLSATSRNLYAAKITHVNK